jgi:hypothetical protein
MSADQVKGLVRHLEENFDRIFSRVDRPTYVDEKAYTHFKNALEELRKVCQS